MDLQTSQKGAVTSLIINHDSIDNSDTEFFFTSDIHFDSVYCNRDLFFEDMNEAVRRDAMICIFGDFFDALNGRFDPRRDMSLLRPEYRRADYYDFVVQDAAEKLKPYANNIMMITPGNHELSVLKNANTYLTDRLIGALNTQNKSNIMRGGYGGWLRLMFKVNKLPEGSTLVKYYHGSGGEAPVTRGVIQTNRQSVYLPDADIVVNGHSHNSYWVPITRERIGGKGDHFFDTQHHVRTPGYMQGYGDGTTGWEVTRGGVPKPLGSCYIKIELGGRHRKHRPSIKVEPIIHNPIAVSPVIDIFQGMVFPQE